MSVDVLAVGTEGWASGGGLRGGLLALVTGGWAGVAPAIVAPVSLPLQYGPRRAIPALPAGATRYDEEVALALMMLLGVEQ